MKDKCACVRVLAFRAINLCILRSNAAIYDEYFGTEYLHTIMRAGVPKSKRDMDVYFQCQKLRTNHRPPNYTHNPSINLNNSRFRRPEKGCSSPPEIVIRHTNSPLVGGHRRQFDPSIPSEPFCRRRRSSSSFVCQSVCLRLLIARVLGEISPVQAKWN